ncbi:MAG: hypothetical protein ACO3LT_09850 [Ilumatobacteraceae bacterium]
MLPQHGLLAWLDPTDEPVAAGWVYLDRFSGVGFPHWLVTKPGLSLKDAKDATAKILKGIEDISRTNGVHTLITTVSEEGILREAINAFGWQFIAASATIYKEIP